MGLLTFAGRIVLVVVNVIFIIISLALVLFGFLLRFANDTFRPFVKSTLDDIEQHVRTVYNDADFNTDNFELGSMVSDIALACIVMGVVFLALSFLGCCGACCNITTIMLLYAIVLIVIAIAQVILVVLAFGVPSVLKDQATDGMVKTLDEYQGVNGTTVASISWNLLMRQFDCCGASDYKDFDTYATQWWGRGQLTTPSACCKTLPNNDAEREQCAGTTSGTRKTIAEIAANSNYSKGCVDAFWDHIFIDNRIPFLTVFAFCMLGQIIDQFVFLCHGVFLIVRYNAAQ